MGTAVSQKIQQWFADDVQTLISFPEFRIQFPQLYWDSDKRDKICRVAFPDALNEWNKLPMKEIIKRRHAAPLSFMRTHHKPYYEPWFSAHIICRLLLEQFDDNQERTRQFLRETFDVLDKRVPKKNTMCIVSPPSSGKTYFVNSLMTLCWKYGQIRNNKKGGDSFTYQDAVDTRINEWNECLLMGKEEIETAKMVWEGAPAPVNVKYKSGQKLQRIPLFVTSNAVPWRMTHGEDKAFRDRCYYYIWKQMPWLKELELYPSPLAWWVICEWSEHPDWWDDVMKTDEIVFSAKEGKADIYYHNWCRKQVTEEQWNNADCSQYSRFPFEGVAPEAPTDVPQ